MARYTLPLVFLAALVASSSARLLQQNTLPTTFTFTDPAPRSVISQNEQNANNTDGPPPCIYQTITLMAVDKYTATSLCSTLSACEWEKESVQTSEECQYWCDQNQDCSVWHFNGNSNNMGVKCMLFTGAIRPSRGLSGNVVGFKAMGIGGVCQTEVPGLVVEGSTR